MATGQAEAQDVWFSFQSPRTSRCRDASRTQGPGHQQLVLCVSHCDWLAPRPQRSKAQAMGTQSLWRSRPCPLSSLPPLEALFSTEDYKWPMGHREGRVSLTGKGRLFPLLFLLNSPTPAFHYKAVKTRYSPTRRYASATTPALTRPTLHSSSSAFFSYLYVFPREIQRDGGLLLTG